MFKSRKPNPPLWKPLRKLRTTTTVSKAASYIALGCLRLDLSNDGWIHC